MGQSFKLREELLNAAQGIWNQFNPSMLKSVVEDWMMKLRRYM
jgi:hypothetical protein